MTTEVIRIVLADDHQLVRDSWKMLLENHPNLEVVGSCDINEDAVTLITELQPDILLIDINMASPLNGLGLAEAVIGQFDAKVVGLSVSNHPKFALRLMTLGGSGYLTKTSTLEEIYRGILEIHQGNTFISTEVKARMSEAERARF